MFHVEKQTSNLERETWDNFLLSTCAGGDFTAGTVFMAVARK
jgi:hypothetical protein